MLEADLCETLLELDSLSGLSEIRLEMEDKRKVRCFTKFGIAVGPAFSKLDVPARLVTMVPRYVVLNNSEENIIARQCYLEVSADFLCFLTLSYYVLLTISNTYSCNSPK